MPCRHTLRRPYPRVPEERSMCTEGRSRNTKSAVGRNGGRALSLQRGYLWSRHEIAVRSDDDR